MAYFGDSKPTITPTEKIQIDGLKNDFTEYLPVKHFNERKENEFMMPRQIKKRHFNETGLSYDSKVNNEDDNLSRMKETFV